MPRDIGLRSSVLLVLCSMTMAVCSCEPTATYHFRVTDAQSGQPLKNVQVNYWWQGYHWSNRLFPDDGDRNLRSTDGDGRTAAYGVIQNYGYGNHFRFDLPGYKALVIYSVPQENWWNFTYNNDPTSYTILSDTQLEIGQVPVVPTETIVVPMYRLGAAVPCPNARSSPASTSATTRQAGGPATGPKLSELLHVGMTWDQACRGLALQYNPMGIGGLAFSYFTVRSPLFPGKQIQLDFIHDHDQLVLESWRVSGSWSDGLPDR